MTWSGGRGRTEDASLEAPRGLGRSSGGWTVLGEVDGVLRGVATLCY